MPWVVALEAALAGLGCIFGPIWRQWEMWAHLQSLLTDACFLCSLSQGGFFHYQIEK